MTTEYISGLSRLKPLSRDEGWMRVGRVVTVMPDSPGFNAVGILHFYRCVEERPSGVFYFDTIRITHPGNKIIPPTTHAAPTNYTRSSFHNGCEWGYFEIHPELKYDPFRQGDTDEDI